MSSPVGSSPAVVCTQCRKQLDTPLCCASCGALNPVPEGGFNYFEIFGLAPGFHLDTAVLHRRYLSLSRGVHPDAVGARDEATRGQALACSAVLNRAYETLRDPVARAEYLLLLAGGPSAADHKTVPGCLLGEIMLLREEIEEAKQSADSPRMEAIAAQVTRRRQEAMDEVGGLCRRLGGDESASRHLRERLNAIKYWNNLLAQLSSKSPV